MEKNKKINTPSNVVIIVIGFGIIIFTVGFLYAFPKNFEIIFGIGTVLFVSLSIFINLQSLATAESARGDSKDAAASAKGALAIAKSEAEANALRYRVEKGSFLALKKRDFYVPLFGPLSYSAKFHTTEDLNARHNPSGLLLVNKGMGTATNVAFSFQLLNARDYHDLKFESDDVADSSTLNESFYRSYHRGFPKYTLSSKIFRNNDSGRDGMLLTCIDNHGNFAEESSPREKRSIQRPLSTQATHVGYLDNEELVWIHLPEIFRVLSHQFFLEQSMLKEEHWKTNNPELLVRIDYTEEISEHMNRFDEARRVKEFRITCSNNINVVQEPADTPHFRTRNILLCQYVIEALRDEPFTNEETADTEVTTDGSVGSIEG
ncbi:hypothetical protein BLD48_15440 [Exiguobacterium sp. KRL4]|uniref:hypothetical protein n=1 Tax=Exiguobacterium sp. KRL4 TaxID=1914536 RepID=UPI0008F8EDBB|nr:hypothetical protein [Exiguobacterium sp. KRL4]OIN65542.1 hypothetical protein BLD48_15440 [Exiguobacterium sp. KRL4]